MDFYDKYCVDILAFFSRRTFDAEAAKDLTAETFAEAWKSRKRFRGHDETESAAWLYSIAHHLFSRYVRRGVVERKTLGKLGIELSALEDGDYERIAELAELEDARASVAGELNTLGHDQRTAIQLRVVDELPYSEVAERLAISEQAARARVSRGLQQLAKALEGAPGFKEMTT